MNLPLTRIPESFRHFRGLGTYTIHTPYIHTYTLNAVNTYIHTCKTGHKQYTCRLFLQLCRCSPVWRMWSVVIDSMLFIRCASMLVILRYCISQDDVSLLVETTIADMNFWTTANQTWDENTSACFIQCLSYIRSF